jgi:hypothetical protein
MTATLTPIHNRQTSARTESLMLFGNPPGLTPIHSRQTSARTATMMLFGNPPSARPRPSTAHRGGATV